MSLTEKEKQEALKYASTGALFIFLPNASLCEKVAKNNPEVSSMGRWMKMALLNKQAICIETKMVIDYCYGILDKDNSFILDNGDIKVIPDQIKI